MGYIPKFIHLDHFITVEYLLGCVVLGLIVATSVETKCLTTIKLRKHEK